MEQGGEVVEIMRHGKPVARLTPPVGRPYERQPPWQALRESGDLAMEPEESVLEALAFDALR